jgi:hypothetical protein
MCLPEEQNTPEESSFPIARKHSGFLTVSSVTPSPKKGNGGGDRVIDKELFVDERKLSSVMVPDAMSTPKMHINNGEHRLIPVTAKMIHSAISTCNRFVLRDGCLLHMVKLVGAVRNYHENIKNITIDVEDGPGLSK